MAAGAPVAGECLSCLEDQRLDLRGMHAQDLRDLTMGVVAKLEQHERGALVLRQLADVVEHLSQFLAPPHLFRKIGNGDQVAVGQTHRAPSADL
jgi:hypothetical protein